MSALRPVGEIVPAPVPLGMLAPELCAIDEYASYFLGSGTQALAAALRAARRSSAAKVLLPAYGCPDLVAATIYAGCDPVLIDTEPDSPFPDLDGASRTLARGDVCAMVIPHFLGIRCDLGPWVELARRHDVMLVEDSAQALLDPESRRPRGDAIVLSFGRGKPLPVGGGGALISRQEIAALESYRWAADPATARTLDDLNAAMQRLLFNCALNPMLFGVAKRIPLLAIGHTRYRPARSITGMRPYLKRCLVAASVVPRAKGPAEAAFDQQLESLPSGWKAVGGQRDPRGLLRYPLLAPTRVLRDAAVKRLSALGVTSFYGGVLTDLPGIPSMLTGPCPNARVFADRLLTLPVHSGVTEAHVGAIARELAAGLLP